MKSFNKPVVVIFFLTLLCRLSGRHSFFLFSMKFQRINATTTMQQLIVNHEKRNDKICAQSNTKQLSQSV